MEEKFYTVFYLFNGLEKVHTFDKLDRLVQDVLTNDWQVDYTRKDVQAFINYHSMFDCGFDLPKINGKEVSNIHDCASIMVNRWYDDAGYCDTTIPVFVFDPSLNDNVITTILFAFAMNRVKSKMFSDVHFFKMVGDNKGMHLDDMSYIYQSMCNTLEVEADGI